MVSLLFVPTGRGANSLQNCCPCSFCSHKQWCLTVLCELWFKVVFNSRTFFFELEAMNSSESRWRCIAIKISKYMKQECQPKLERDIEKFSRNKSFDSRARFGAIIIVPLKPKSTFYRIARLAIGLCFKNKKRWNYLSRKFKLLSWLS